MKLEKFTKIGKKYPNVAPKMCEDRIFTSKSMMAVIDNAYIIRIYQPMTKLFFAKYVRFQ